MSLTQHTIQNSVSLTGVGLHSGITTTVTFKPAVANSGIRFVRIDLPQHPDIPVIPQSLVMDKGISRCTVIQKDGVRVSTIEHILAALSGLGIDQVIIEINGEEVPGMDGSAKEFTQALLSAGIVDLQKPKDIYVITAPIKVEHNGSSVLVVPSDRMRVNYFLDYEHPLLKQQRFGYEVNQENFMEEIATARTFCLESEAAAIREKGLGKGASSKNTLIMADHGPVDNQLRFDNECCRHKALDIIGDLYTLGFSICGEVYGIKSGHALNRALVQKIIQQRTESMTTSNQTHTVYDIDQIKTILPHRYPFLFVDRVIEVEKGVKVIGVKNVTTNESFFQGHFPQKPVMPGVIMIEAMAQTAGVLLLTSGTHDGKVALFMAIDDVKFRRVVVPGDQLIMEIEVIRDRERTGQVKGVARVNGEVVVEGMLMFSYTDAAYLTQSTDV